jgi:hypothetical protein
VIAGARMLPKAPGAGITRTGLLALRLSILSAFLCGSTFAADSEPLSRLTGQWNLDSSLTFALSGQNFPSLSMTLESEAGKNPGELPPGLADLPEAGEFVDSGTLTLGDTVGSYGVFARQGQRFLVFAPSGAAAPRISRLWLIEAPSPRGDLLFLADTESGQILAMERRTDSSQAPLSHFSEALLDVALRGEVFSDAEQARQLLAERPDWQAVVAHLLADLASDPAGDHNNRCLTLYPLVKEHSEAVQFDLDPLLATLRTPKWTNRQKCAYVLDALAARKDLFEGHRNEALATLIRMVPSQRGRLVDAALDVLRKLTGQSFGRDPEAWRSWYVDHTGESLDLTGSVHELLILVRLQHEPGGFEVGTESVDSVSEVVEQVRAQVSRSKLPVSIVLRVESTALSSSTSGASIPAPAMPLVEALQPLGLPLTVAPDSDVFYPPYLPAIGE